MKHTAIVLLGLSMFLSGCSGAPTPSDPSASEAAAITSIPSPTTGVIATPSTSPQPSPTSSAPAATGPQATATATATAHQASPSPSAVADDFRACDFQPGPGAHPWLCRTVSVPIDRADPASGHLDIQVYVLPHDDQTLPAGIPLFASPGGPGSDGFDNYVLYATQPQIHAHHDIVTLDPRGTGHSGPIDCPALQTGTSSHEDFLAAVSACAAQLGDLSSRYGAADRAMDIEAIRSALGYPQIDFYGGSYGSVDAQAYAARYPKQLHALVLDSGFPVTDPGHISWSGGPYGAPGLVHVVALLCSRDSTCAGLTPDPESTLRNLVETVRDHPVDGSPQAAPSHSVHVDDLAVAQMLALAEPNLIISAAMDLQDGDPQPLIDIANDFRPFAPQPLPQNVTPFSMGANLAGWCNDQDTAWNRTDPISARRAAYDSYLSSLPADAFAPFSIRGWSDYMIMDACLEWPAPRDFTPVIPQGSTLPQVPTLLLGGDEDNGVPLGITRVLAGDFPDAFFVPVSGANHVTMSQDGPCVPSIVAGFLETLKLPDTSCAGTPG